MNYTNEEIAWAAGFCTTNEGTDFCLDVDAEFQKWMRMPDWPTDPGAVATWLLPVLEKRLGEYACWARKDEYVIRSMKKFIPFPISPTWHECVIEAIMATAPTP